MPLFKFNGISGFGGAALFGLLIYILTSSIVEARTTTDSVETTTSQQRPLRVVMFRWNYVSDTLLFSLFLLLVALVGVLVHQLRCISRNVPETCILILVGVLVAGLLLLSGYKVSEKQFSNKVFMLYLLPPIVLDAAYGLNSRTFAANAGTVLLHAVLGTLVNVSIIAPSLYGLYLAGAMGSTLENLTPIDFFLFSSFIVAVDPVAVIAIFKDLGVNDMLYFLVFGESLLNDAVTVVIFDLMSIWVNRTSITSGEIATGFAFFLVSSVGGAAIGVLMGIITSIITKFTHKQPDVEPVIVILMAYISYLLGQLFEWSSIIAITTCGIVQAQTVFPNLSYESELTIKKIAGVSGSILEAFVFLFLGGDIVLFEHVWNAGFILWTLFFILVGRAISVFGLTSLANLVRTEKIDLRHQFIMWYGGLRGALAFVLCASLSRTYAPRNLFLTATIIVILFTVFVQGTTIRFFVRLLRVKMKDKEPTPVLVGLNDMVLDHFLSGIEVIDGSRGENYVREQLYIYGDRLKKYISRFHSTYSTVLIEDLEQKAFEEVGHIRQNRPEERWLCCSRYCGRRCCSKSKELHNVTEPVFMEMINIEESSNPPYYADVTYNQFDTNNNSSYASLVQLSTKGSGIFKVSSV